ncbi:MAG: ATP-binding protein, partial [Pseudomonadota bacterium]
RDYLGDNDPHRPAVGSVVIWTDATAAFREFKQGQLFNIVYGVFGFILVESILWAAMRFGEGRLRAELARATEAHRAAAERNRAILDAAAEGIYGIDRTGRTSFVNRAASEMVGWDPAEIVGRPHHALIHHTAASGGPYPEADCPILATLADGDVRSVSGEVFWRKDGGAFPVDYVVGPLRGGDGRIEGAVVVFRDDTERLRARREIEEKAAALEASNHELAQFASVISHDLQAPLRMVVSYLGLIQQKLGGSLDDEAREFLGFAIGGGKRMSAMVRDLLAYSRVGRDRVEVESVDLREVVETVLGDLSLPIEDCGAIIEVAPGLPTVTGRGGDLMRLVENLVTNALKYRHPDRPLRISIAAVRLGTGWRIDVTDNGLGIPADQRERVFGFFQRVGRSPDEEGSGIGLAIARKIAGQHGGRIWVEDGPGGEGCRFSFTLPAA